MDMSIQYASPRSDGKTDLDGARDAFRMLLTVSIQY